MTRQQGDQILQELRQIRQLLETAGREAARRRRKSSPRGRRSRT